MSLQKLVREWKLMIFIILCTGMNNPINETNIHDSDETISSNMATANHDVEAITMLMPKNGSKTDNANGMRCLRWSVELPTHRDVAFVKCASRGNQQPRGSQCCRNA
jgi:hypothetical protein